MRMSCLFARPGLRKTSIRYAGPHSDRQEHCERVECQEFQECGWELPRPDSSWVSSRTTRL